MSLLKLFTSAFFLSSALLADAAVTQEDFTGLGHIHVIASEDWRTANPEDKIGCLSDTGRLVQASSGCGTFSRLDVFPWTLSSKEGNCTFENTKTEKNTDSHYGTMDHAWSCSPELFAEIYDELYTIDGFPYPYLCFGNMACYYDAKQAPKQGEDLPLWKFRWGSQQRGITPGHLMLILLWEKLNDTKRENVRIPGPRLVLTEGQQITLQGRQLH